MNLRLLVLPWLAAAALAGCGGAVQAQTDEGQTDGGPQAPLDATAGIGADVAAAPKPPVDASPPEDHHAGDDATAVADGADVPTPDAAPLDSGNGDADGDANEGDAHGDASEGGARPPGPPGMTGAPCARESDCAEGLTCGYNADDGCTAQGRCIVAEAAPCSAVALMCSCNGVIMDVGCNYASGDPAHPEVFYAPAPVAQPQVLCVPPPDAGSASDCGAWGSGCFAGKPCCSGLHCGGNGYPHSFTPIGYCVP
jgi:hypothetical protein